MFVFDWAEFATDDVVDAVLAADDGGDSPDRALVAELIGTALWQTGGLPFADESPSTDERSAVARRLLAEAIDHYEAACGRRPPGRGFILTPSSVADVETTINPTARVDVNLADASTLEALPAIGRATAQAIVAERRRHGYFTTLAEMAERVDGFGETMATALEQVLIFGAPGSIEPRTERPADLTALVAHSIALSGATGERRVERLLEAIVSTVSRSPHPATAEGQIRTFVGQAPPAFAASTVGVLADGAYYGRLADYLGDATSSIVVAMFHAALPEPNHPTRELLDALIAAHGRGVDVRVLLDQDRPTDPYMSLAINGDAKKYLDDAGVACRFDAAEVLLHSKFVVIDDALSIIGSHNWSAGSFFGFDDLSFAIRSADFASSLRQRFDALWS